MFVFILRRLLQASVVMVSVAFIAFLLFQYVGDPGVFLLGQDARPDQIRQLRSDLGLDQPFFVQFWHFLTNAVQGEFGLSLRQGAKVSRLLGERFPATMELALMAALLALDLARFQTRPQIEESLASGIPSLNLRRFLLKNLGRDDSGRFIWKMNVRGLAENYSRLGEILSPRLPFPQPALFIRGGKSDYIDAADEVEIRRLFPAAQIHAISAAGHWVHADAPQEFIRLVLDFL